MPPRYELENSHHRRSRCLDKSTRFYGSLRDHRDALGDMGIPLRAPMDVGAPEGTAYQVYGGIMLSVA